MKRSVLNRPHREGFALVSTLAILLLVTIMIVAFTATMRTELSASANFSERERAQALGVGMINRILAEYATADATGAPIKPFAVDPGKQTVISGSATEQTYYGIGATPPHEGIYALKPSPSIGVTASSPYQLPPNHLVQISETTGSTGKAYFPKYWAYARQENDPDFYPKSITGTELTPSWVPVKNDAGELIGEVAYAIWDEGGKIDANMLGKDPNINGLAPYDLKLEDQLFGGNAAAFLAFLNGSDNMRQRSNFSLRTISPIQNGAGDKTGDDKWTFSIEELLARGWLDPAYKTEVTTFSRDFDTRPQWSGLRTPSVNTVNALKSYVNNPDLFALFNPSSIDGKVYQPGPLLVNGNLDQARLTFLLKTYDFPWDKTTLEGQNWLQLARLLATIRRSLPPYYSDFNTAKRQSDPTTPLANDFWWDNDVFAIAMNIVLATTPISTNNLLAYDAATYPNNTYKDIGARLGIRAAPLLTEMALRVKVSADAKKVACTEFLEFWNPYPMDAGVSNNTYSFRANSGGGQKWNVDNNPGLGCTLFGTPTPSSFTGPLPGKFVVVRMERPEETLNAFERAKGGILIRANPIEYLTSKGYPAPQVASTMLVTSFFGAGIQPTSIACYWIPLSKLTPNATVWFSYQIDDPRMGTVPRYGTDQDPGALLKNSTGNKLTAMPYHWQPYPNKHSLYGITEGPKYVDPDFGDGYNENFLSSSDPALTNIPPAWKSLPRKERLNLALQTFSVPGRPFKDLGELGNIFAYRPWRTLTLGATVPQKTGADKIGVNDGEAWTHYTTNFLDNFTTLGTTTLSTNLTGMDVIGSPNNKLRRQNLRYLFEAVANDTTSPSGYKPAGNLRPIRGRVNLNTVSEKLLTLLLVAPYQVSNNLAFSSGLGDSFGNVTYPISSDEKTKIAQIAKDIVTIRNTSGPYRGLADLGKLDDPKFNLTGLKNLRLKSSILANAVIGRLGQLATVRQQAYTIDLVARSLKPVAGGGVSNATVTGEVRLRARVYFDTFSRRAYIDSIESL